MNAGRVPYWWRHAARLTRLNGSIIHAPLRRTFVGERCEVRRQPDVAASCLCQAQTIGFTDTQAILSLLGPTQGIARDVWVVPTGKRSRVKVDDATLGAAFDGDGILVSRMAQAAAGPGVAQQLDIDGQPPALTRRRPVQEIFETGIRAIDGLLTCGLGQRIGIFAAAGGGKTTMVSTLIAHAKADVYVVGLIGERGREASEFLLHGIPADKRARTVLVCSTSDRPAAERRNAAHMATAIAEHYRDRGLRVLLVLDSMTRYARALRDLALSAGERPARRGYPPSVFEALPRLLERAGAVEGGSITAFYTVLLEDEEQADPIGEEVQSLVDGHIYLSRKLAERAHYPAIDVLKSSSRVMQRLVRASHLAAASSMRDKLGRLADLQLALDLGEYRAGENPLVDALLEQRADLDDWLRQSGDAPVPFDDTVEALHDLQ